LVQEDRIVDELLQLVQISSETKFEREICDVLKAKFSELGLHVEEDDSASITGHGAGNLIAVLPATEGMEKVVPLLFTAHMDTVVPGKNVRPRVEDGYIFSDGTTVLGSDDKAGIAAMLEAIRVIKEQNIPHGRIEFVITAGEEAGLIGAKALDPKRLQAKYGYALDSNEKVGAIAVAAPFQASIRVLITGKSAHAGVNPEEGISAIQVASKAISRMPLGRIDKETTANIGSFEGKGPTNIVCDKVEIMAEARSIREPKLKQQLDTMLRCFEEAAKEFGASVQYETEITPGFLFEDDAEVVQLASRAIEKIGRTPRTFHSGGGSDANIFNGMGIPTVNLAVGYEQIHTVNERMPITELVKTAELVVAIIQESIKRIA
jgi:tripeptide aminopeptidase